MAAGGAGAGTGTDSLQVPVAPAEAFPLVEIAGGESSTVGISCGDKTDEDLRFARPAACEAPEDAGVGGGEDSSYTSLEGSQLFRELGDSGGEQLGLRAGRGVRGWGRLGKVLGGQETGDLAL